MVALTTTWSRLKAPRCVNVAECLILRLGPDRVGHGIRNQLLPLNVHFSLMAVDPAVAPAPAGARRLGALVGFVRLDRLDRGVNVDSNNLDGVQLRLWRWRRANDDRLRRWRGTNDDRLWRRRWWRTHDHRLRLSNHNARWRPWGRDNRSDPRAGGDRSVGWRLEIESLFVLVVSLPARGFVVRIHVRNMCLDEMRKLFVFVKGWQKLRGTKVL